MNGKLEQPRGVRDARGFGFRGGDVPIIVSSPGLKTVTGGNGGMAELNGVSAGGWSGFRGQSGCCCESEMRERDLERCGGKTTRK